jgi:hypothetical protein
MLFRHFTTMNGGRGLYAARQDQKRLAIWVECGSVPSVSTQFGKTTTKFMESRSKYFRHPSLDVNKMLLRSGLFFVPILPKRQSRSKQLRSTSSSRNWYASAVGTDFVIPQSRLLSPRNL